MNHEQALLQEILEQPAETAARLVYADWLEERDDPRAELIRVQCTLVDTSDSPPGERHALRRREGELLAAHAFDWLGPLRRHLEGWEFRRGFVESIRLRGAVFLEHAAALRAAYPLREVVFSGVCDTFEQLARSPHLAGLESLAFRQSWLAYRAAVLAGSPHLTRLASLDLTNNGIGREELRELAHSPNLPALRTLILHRNRGLGNDGLEVLLASPLFPRLGRLELGGCGLTDVAARALAAHPALAGIERLDLADNSISLAGFGALLSSPYWRRRTVLRLSEGKLSRLRAEFGLVSGEW